MKIVITGASKGIGREVALTFAEQGCSHLFLCARHLGPLQDLKLTIEAKYTSTSVHIFSVDMSKKEEVIDFGEKMSALTNSVDVLVNNAGVFYPGSILDEEEGALESLISTNLYSAYFLTRKMVPLIKKSSKGHIFNMCSIASFMAYANGGSYAISKFAMLGFSKVLREELKDKGIRVTALMPGATWTDSWEGSGIPPERMMQASDVANTIFAAYALPPSAVVEEIIMRPQMGDL